MSKRPLSFARLLDLPENHSALIAVQVLSNAIKSGHQASQPNPLFLHGPAGTGKTCLVKALHAEVLRYSRQAVVGWLSAKELEPLLSPQELAAQGSRLVDEMDLLIVEDLHHLAPRWADSLAEVIDDLKGRHIPVLFTALTGPRFLPFPGRLISRLTSGLVVGLKMMQTSSRLRFLQAKAQEGQMVIRHAALAWLAQRARGSGRELEGILVRLEALSQLQAQPLDVTTVARCFDEEFEANKPTFDRIMEQVSDYFQLSTAQLFSQRRDRRLLVPRHVGMYLTRRLTGLSFGEIGSRFGGRDHSTVLHGCRKIAAALAHDTSLAGTVQQLEVALT
jgi:chromosomal replication initiator protein